jgi:predicted DNA-binding protein
MNTTVKMSIETKKRLDSLKIHPRETYDDVIKRLIEEHGGRGE